MTCLPRFFYERSTLLVAHQLLGCRLVRVDHDKRLVGMIVETEAYRGEEDQGCHAKAGRTLRTEIMYGPGGHAYIYFTYGMHWLLNAVTEPAGFPAAVLIRAILPLEGIEDMASNRPMLAHTTQWTNGPAKLTQALHLDGEQNGCDICDPQGELFIMEGEKPISEDQVITGPRVGLFSVPEPWKSIPWRFMLKMDSAK